MLRDGLRTLPSIDQLLQTPALLELLARYPRWAVVRAARAEVDRHRTRLLHRTPEFADGLAGRSEVDVDAAREPSMTGAESASGARGTVDPARIGRDVARLVRATLRPAINATGVVLHTNLGRAPLSDRAIAAVAAVARGYCTLEYDPESRSRGSRHVHVADILADLVGAESSVVVNNNAGAVLLALAALAAGRRVVVSRGELVEIGGGFRVPDVMRAAGAQLVEVGTTNKTHPNDYRSELAQGAALAMKVHRSNFQITGFTEEVGHVELVAIAREVGVPVFYDLGSGLLEGLDLSLPAEPSVRSVLASGVDLCAFSGDKLLGGPQAGVLVGRRELIEPIARHPLFRALRPDKMCLAALHATLESYREGTSREEIPALQMLGATYQALELRRDRLLSALTERGIPAHGGRLTSAVGGGALPGTRIASPVVLLGGELSPEVLAAGLALGEPPVIVRVHEGKVVLDVRTVSEREVPDIVRAVLAAHGQTGRGGSARESNPPNPSRDDGPDRF